MPKRCPVPSANSRFGMLTFTGNLGRMIRNVSCECICDCGTRKYVRLNELISGTVRSCGCLRRLGGKYRNGKPFPEYCSWLSIMQRCYNPAHRAYPNYGGRGVSVHDEWRDDFKAFLAHIGPRPTLGHSIDRINNDGNYEPGNVRWATMKEQARNKRTNRLLRINGRVQCVTDWAEELRSTPWRVLAQYKRGELV